MTTVCVGDNVHIQRQGRLYAAIVNGYSFISTDPEELLETIRSKIESQYDELFGSSSTWTFVESGFAAFYDQEVQIRKALASPAALNPANRQILNPFFRNSISIPQETKDAVDWVEQNAKSDVKVWRVPLTQKYFYLFEDANEAMLFKLSVAA